MRKKITSHKIRKMSFIKNSDDFCSTQKKEVL